LRTTTFHSDRIGLATQAVEWRVFRPTHATLGEQIGMALSDRQAQMDMGTFGLTMHYTHSTCNDGGLALKL